jgi:hypothetical protein
VTRCSRAALGACCLLAACGGGSPTTNNNPTTGTLSVQVSGLGGATATIQVSGPGGFSRSLSSSQSFTAVTPGSYTITAPAASTTAYDYAPTAATQSVDVTAGNTATATVTYAATTGALSIALAGLPTGKTADVTVSGPSGFVTHATTTGTLNRLAPGQYTFTVAAVSEFGMGWGPTTAPAAVTVTAGATANQSMTFDLLVAGRTTTDRADDVASQQVKVLYVTPSDGADASLDNNRTLLHTIGSWQRWFAGQAAGKYVRLDTYQGMVDIAFVRLPRTGAAMAGYGLFLRDTLEKDLKGLGWTGANGKLYAVYYEGVSTTACGTGPHPPALPGIVTALYLHGTITGAPACDTNPFATAATAAPGYLEFVMMHELVHMFGGVGVTAPNYVDPGHVGNDPRDLMYAGALPWNPSILDVSKTNYYNPAGLAGGLFNLASSGYLAGP